MGGLNTTGTQGVICGHWGVTYWVYKAYETYLQGKSFPVIALDSSDLIVSRYRLRELRTGSIVAAMCLYYGNA